MKKAPQKIYVVDNGFIYAKSFELSSNSEKRLENMVFIELLRRGYNLEKNLFYFRSRTDKEIDFVTREGNKVTSLIQVSYEISSGRSRERELKAFVEGAKELKCNKLLLITWNTKETIEYKGLTIQAIPITEWGL
jgi:Predicted ATPase (AAA+ superfamily)